MTALRPSLFEADRLTLADSLVTGPAAVIDGHWLSVRDGDPRALAIYLRHYSAKKARARYHVVPIGNRARFVGNGAHVILLTRDCDALFAWREQRFRKDGQTGVECSVFRSERGDRPPDSSELVAEAIRIAWQRWPGVRLFTFIDPREVRSPNPGYCFKVAGPQPADGRQPAACDHARPLRT